MALEVLSPETCRLLLEEAHVGWLAHSVEDVVHMVPVNVAVHAAELVFHAGYGETLDAAVRRRTMTFGAGAFDPATRTGWSVTVTGTAHLVGDALVNPGLPDADVWPDLPRTVAIGLPLTTITGRRTRTEPAN